MQQLYEMDRNMMHTKNIQNKHDSEKSPKVNKNKYQVFVET